MQRWDLENRFAFHAATPTTGPRHDAVRAAALAFALAIDAFAGPDSREKSLAVTAAEEAMFWANAAIEVERVTAMLSRNKPRVYIPPMGETNQAR